MFSAVVENGRISLGSLANKERVRQWAAKNEGARLEINPVLPESRKQRAWYFASLLPLWAYLDGRDWRDPEVIAALHEVAKLEFNGEIIEMRGKAYKIGKSSKGPALKAFVERVQDWIIEQYAPPAEALDVAKWKKWRNEIYMIPGGPDTYLEYLEEIGILKIYGPRKL